VRWSAVLDLAVTPVIARIPIRAPPAGSPTAVPDWYRGPMSIGATGVEELAWVGRALGGRVVAAERQSDRPHGGRPAWFVDVERDGGPLRVYARLQRPELRDGGAALEREGAVLDALAAGGLLVPRVLGVHSDPPGLLLECLSGTGDYAELDEDARWDVDRRFLEELVKLHAVDTAPFRDAGLVEPRDAPAFLLDDLDRWEAVYRAMTNRPVPLVEFLCRWLRRHVPPAPVRASVLQGDTGPGQFMFDGSTLTGVVDWEFAQLGDPHLDLALIRGRDFYNPGADLRRWFQTYQDLSGTVIDWDALAVYSVKALALTPMSLAGLCQSMPWTTDYAEWWTMNATYSRATAQALAEATGVVTADDDIVLPEPAVGTVGGFLDVMDAVVDHEFRPADPFGSSRADQAMRLSRMIRNAASSERELTALELDDLSTVLGHRPRDPMSGDNELVGLITEDDPSRDADLAAYLWRRTIRHEALFVGALGAGEGAVLQPIADLR